LPLFGAVGLLLAHAGAFSTGDTPPAVRYAYFGGLSLAGGLLAVLLMEAADRGRLGRLPGSARLMLVILLLSLVLTPIVWVAAALLLDGAWSPMRLIPLAGQVTPVAALLVPLVRLADLPLTKVSEPPGGEPDAPSSLLRRLPPDLRGSRLIAIGAEDHYLRVHSEAGSALILMRFADALRAVEPLDGAQTHRSWWVSRDAVLGARRGDGRAVLSLPDGLEVPVSRRHARRLRRLGWF
jgi:DNA-binding LytR/AlgR family response regulator